MGSAVRARGHVWGGRWLHTVVVGLSAAVSFGCSSVVEAGSGRDAGPGQRAVAAAADAGAIDGARVQASAVSPGYPVDTRPPRATFDPRLLRILTREASAVVVCRLQGLTDVFPQHRDPDIFYDAHCSVVEVIRGKTGAGELHFIWQVERGNPMPPPGSELLVYLKARKEPLDGPPDLKWVAVETGVLRYTPALRDALHGRPKKKQ